MLLILFFIYNLSIYSEACNAVVRSVYEEIDGGDMQERQEGENCLRRNRIAPFPPPPLPPHAHTAVSINLYHIINNWQSNKFCSNSCLS